MTIAKLRRYMVGHQRRARTGRLKREIAYLRSEVERLERDARPLSVRERIVAWFAESTWIRSLPWAPSRDLVFDRAILDGTAVPNAIRHFDTPATTPEEIGARTLGMRVDEFLVWAEDPWARSGCPRPAETTRPELAVSPVVPIDAGQRCRGECGECGENVHPAWTHCLTCGHDLTGCGAVPLSEEECRRLGIASFTNPRPEELGDDCSACGCSMGMHEEECPHRNPPPLVTCDACEGRKVTHAGAHGHSTALCAKCDGTGLMIAPLVLTADDLSPTSEEMAQIRRENGWCADCGEPRGERGCMFCGSKRRQEHCDRRCRPCSACELRPDCPERDGANPPPGDRWICVYCGKEPPCAHDPRTHDEAARAASERLARIRERAGLAKIPQEEPSAFELAYGFTRQQIASVALLPAPKNPPPAAPDAPWSCITMRALRSYIEYGLAWALSAPRSDQCQPNGVATLPPIAVDRRRRAGARCWAFSPGYLVACRRGRVGRATCLGPPVAEVWWFAGTPPAARPEDTRDQTDAHRDGVSANGRAGRKQDPE